MSVPPHLHRQAHSPIPRGSTPTAAANLACHSLEFKALREQSTRRMAQLFLQFAAYVERGHGCLVISGVSIDMVRGFVLAPAEGDDPSLPSLATTHLRRSAVRLLFRLVRHLGLVDRDPTQDIKLPPRSSLRKRPLTDDEVLLCRSYSIKTLSETRQPAAWALAEATARTAEIPLIRGSNIDLEAGRVFIAGGTRTEARWGFLTEWGMKQLDRRLRSLKRLPGDPLVIYRGRGSPESAQASSCSAIQAVLVRAGLGGEPDIGPGSVAAWTGAEARARGFPIEDVARMLGVRSLDRAARLIGWDWRSKDL